MTRLALLSTAVGTLVVAARVPGILFPARFRAWAVRFPRALWPGRILMGIAALIVWWVMYHAATDEWKWAQPLVLFGVPVAYWLVAQFATHYLSLRAVAVLMLLVAKLLLDAADLSDVPLRLIVTVYAYIWVVTAIWLASAPHHIRDAIGWAMASDQRCRLLCAAGGVFGLALIGLGVFVY